MKQALAAVTLLLLLGCGATPLADAGVDAGRDAGPVCDPPASPPMEFCSSLAIGRPCEARWSDQAHDGGTCTGGTVAHLGCGAFLGWRYESASGIGPTNECFYVDGGLVGSVYRSDVGTSVAGTRPVGCAWSTLCSPDAGP